MVYKCNKLILSYCSVTSICLNLILLPSPNYVVTVIVAICMGLKTQSCFEIVLLSPCPPPAPTLPLSSGAASNHLTRTQLPYFSLLYHPRNECTFTREMTVYTPSETVKNETMICEVWLLPN